MALGVRFFIEVFHAFGGVVSMSESDLILTLLSMIDLVLVGSLIVMVTFSGYENCVSRIDAGDEAERLGWLGRLDAHRTH